MAEVTVRAATQKSKKLEIRDVRALCWTVKSLTDDHALQPLIDGLSDIIWGSQGRRHLYDYIIWGLLEDLDIRLTSRIQQCLQNSISDVLPPSVATSRQISCLKAIWAIGALSCGRRIPFSSFQSFDLSLLQVISHLPLDSPALADYLPSVRALILWNLFQSFST